MSESVERFKDWFGKALDEFARYLEELDIRLKVGELTKDDVWDLYYFINAKVLEIIRKRPKFLELVRRAVPMLQFLGEVLRIPPEEGKDERSV